MSNKSPNKRAPLRIVLASGNAGKLAEFEALLQDWHCEVVPQSRFSVPEVIEDGDNFVANALLKAHAAAQYSGLPAIADDSGLDVDALAGAPGIFSARYAGENASDADNNRKLLQALKGVPEAQRTARFHCALVYLRHWQDPNPIICQASWEGRILESPRGDQGFGYDPLFLVEDQTNTSAELLAAEKNRISHRGQAMAKLLEALQQEYP
jgi:XTP/dITP diphosphohydrolase